MIKKILKLGLKHKFIFAVLAIAIIGGGYYGYSRIFSTDGETRYVLAQVRKGTLIVSISGTGNISASNQVDIKPKVSGDIVYVGVKNGQKVKAGTLIAQLDTGDAQKTVRDAKDNFESAKIVLDELKLQQQQQSRGDALNKAYEEGMKTLTDFYREFSTIFMAVNDILFGNDLSDYYEDNITYYTNYFLSNSQEKSPLPQLIKLLYSEIKKLHEKSLIDFQAANIGSGEERRQAINSGYELAVKTVQLIKQGRDAVQPLYDYFISSNSSTHTKWDIIKSHYNDLSTYVSTMDAYLQSLLVIQNTINSQNDIIENQLLKLRSQELTVKQRENALLDAQEKLSDYYLRALSDGIVAKINVKEGDKISAGTTIATIITKQKIAEISLNEVDVAKVKVGQKATLTFDAIPDLTITGQVTEIDTVGTVSQGVVTYNLKIGFDTDDERVKPGMSVSATIVTDIRPNVLLIPNSAVKSQKGINYVELPDSGEGNIVLAKNMSGVILKNPLRRQTVEIGAANDEFTEIISGLNEREFVIARTIQPNANQKQTQSSGELRIPGIPTGRRIR